MTTVTRAEYARQRGWSRGTVTRAVQSGRLVETPDGLIDIEASDERYAATADPGRADVAQRHAEYRAARTTPQSREIGGTYQAARAVKEKFLAMEAKRSYEVNIGRLVEKAEVEASVADTVVTFRQSLENMPHMIAPLLVGREQEYIRATLREEIHFRLAEMEKHFRSKLQELGQGHGG